MSIILISDSLLPIIIEAVTEGSMTLIPNPDIVHDLEADPFT
jgi:hypothetical protein